MRQITFDGKTQSVKRWSKELRVSRQQIYNSLKNLPFLSLLPIVVKNSFIKKYETLPFVVNGKLTYKKVRVKIKPKVMPKAAKRFVTKSNQKQLMLKFDKPIKRGKAKRGRPITCNGITQRMVDWAKELNIPAFRLHLQLKKRSLEEIIQDLAKGRFTTRQSEV
ncbi:MAG: hypothetical protein M0R80_07570 [Proteobacteria bacterium]|jgi:hypothetical protein|nr:hypothetical protein [Pseudomonadota bacterium]